MNSADQLIYNASLLADVDDVEGAMAALEDAISLSEVAGFHLQLLRARLFYGELLLALDRNDDAAAQFLGVLVVSAHFRDEPELVSDEVAAATEHLERLGGDDA